jgi:NAD(P)-dependent dehydrogenase (short-subunit alcohol dehydrogenase family)
MGILGGRIAIVTGASSGIGRGCAVRFAEEGATVVACARRLDKLKDVVDEIKARGGRALAIACDVAKEENIDNVVNTTIKEFGRVDILANIAQGGLEQQEYLIEVTPKRLLDVYITGPLQSLLFMQKCFPHMKKHGYGRIINCSSHSMLMGTPGFSAYEMAKGAVSALTRNASQEWAKFGIVTNVFLPVIRTEAFNNSEQGKVAAKQLESSIPVGRFGLPYEDCSPIVAFMASEGAGYLNGQTIAVDGGNSLIA